MYSVTWQHHLDSFAKALLNELGVDPQYLPTDHNPITDALLDPNFVETYQHLKGFSRAAMSRVATICQMAVFDAQNGPEGDGQPKALRRHWYAWYKGTFAQRIAPQLGDVTPNDSGMPEMDDRIWSQRLSITYGALVDTGTVTYQDLWVSDASRMIEEYYRSLFSGCNVIVCVEKDSLFADFTGAAKRLGARAVYSGKGKSSKAAIEKLLREVFYWSDSHDPFSYHNPLIVLHVSDHDFDGHKVIEPTFGEQCRRYTSHVVEARIGVKPQQVRELAGWGDHSWYKIKLNNAGYKTWANEHALFLAECSDCGHQYPVLSADRHHFDNLCPECFAKMNTIELGKDTAFGFEVEALKTHQYSAMFVDALLECIPFDTIVSNLRQEVQAHAPTAISPIANEVLSNNESYQELLAELAKFDKLVAMRERFEQRVEQALTKVATPHQLDWQDKEPDPTVQQFRDHVANPHAYNPWQPFSETWQTQQLTGWVRENKGNVVEALERVTVTKLTGLSVEDDSEE